jgi:cobalt/nickel transport system permease protein
MMALIEADSLLTETRAQQSPLHRLDARAKILGFIGFTVVVVTTPALPMWPFALYAAILFFLVGVSRLPLKHVLRRALIVLPFILMVAIFLPFFHQAGGGGYSLGGMRVTGEGLLILWNVGAKAVLGVLSMIILSSTTAFPDMVSGFERLKTPRIFVLIVSFMYRYSFVFADELRRMRRAMVARNYRARWLWNVPTLGYMLSALFLRSYSRGERVYVAMLSRGYESTVRLVEGSAFRAVDAMFLGGLLVVVISVRAVASL